MGGGLRRPGRAQGPGRRDASTRSQVYGAFTTRAVPGGRPVTGQRRAATPAPGGTLYRPGCNDVYFPQGRPSGGAPRRAQFVSFDAHAYAYGLDTSAAWPARDALVQHVAGQQALVAGNGTRRRPDLQLRLRRRLHARTGTTAARSTRPPSSRPGGWRCTSAATPGTGVQPAALDGATYAPLPTDDAGADRLVVGAARLEPGRRAAQPVAPPMPAARPSLGPARGRWPPRR